MPALFRHILTVILILISVGVIAFPTSEKTPVSASAPLDILTSQPSWVLVPTSGDFKDKYLFYSNGSSLEAVDLETWAASSLSFDTFSQTINGAALLQNGTSLILGLSNGNLARVELNDEDSFENTQATEDDDAEDDYDDGSLSDSREIASSTNMTSSAIDAIIADPDDSNIVYMLNNAGYFYEFNLNGSILTEVELVNEEASTTDTTDDDVFDGEETETSTTLYTVTDFAFADSSSGEKILITTSTGQVLVTSPGSGTFSVVELSTTSSKASTENPNFSKIVMAPDNNSAFIIDSDNDVIWVFSAANNSFVDQITTGTSLDPISIDDADDNQTFIQLIPFTDNDNNSVFYVSGANGLTLLDANNPDTATSTTKVIDAVDSTTTNDTPITLTSTAGPLAATSNSAGAGYVFSVNGDSSISVLTENPWITVSSASETSLTEINSTFTVTFQSDQTGSYRLYANSNPSQSTGTQLTNAADLNTVDTNITSASIDINNFSRSTFIEGSNKIFVFVTDANGNLGHTATVVNVDRPPEATSIASVTFGNQRAFINFNLSPDEDIASYSMYAQPAANQSDPTCPGSLTFTGSTTISGSVTADECGRSDPCEASLSGLVNDTTYCVAVQVVDQGGQVSGLATSTTPITPEQTVGPAGFFGESGCALTTGSAQNIMGLFLFFVPLGVFLFLRSSRKAVWVFALFLVTSFISFPSQAVERTPQNWTLEVRGTSWFPQDSGFKDFTGTFGHFMGEIEFGFLYRDQFNFTVTAGGGYESGSAVGITNNQPSGDSFSLLLIPLRLDFIYRFDYKSDQLFLPYVRAGGDAVIFRESTNGDSIMNVKFGVHGGAGVGILLDRAESVGQQLEDELGVNDIYLVIEGRYALINSFQSTGLDLSGFYPYIGVLFEF